MIPEQLKLGGLVYVVEEVTELNVNQGKTSVGYPNTLRYEIEAAAPEVIKKEQLLIQVISSIGILMYGEHRKKESAIMARGLFALLRDNPQLAEGGGRDVWGLDSIRYLGKSYTIHKRPGINHNMASIHYVNMTIDIQESFRPCIQWFSLWHEVGHLIRMAFGLDVRELGGEDEECIADDLEDEEERIIDLWAFFIMSLFSQNDMRWLVESADETRPDYHP